MDNDSARAAALLSGMLRLAQGMFYFFINSTRRFSALPSAVSLEAIGDAAPFPSAVKRVESTPN
jgi:hypothetical protein